MFRGLLNTDDVNSGQEIVQRDHGGQNAVGTVSGARREF